MFNQVHLPQGSGLGAPTGPAAPADKPAQASPAGRRVVLIWPSALPEPTMGLLAVATELKHAGFVPRIVDPDERQRQDPAALEAFVRRHVSPDTLWVGFTVMTPFIDLALAMCRVVRAISPNIKTVWGGPHASLFPEQTASHPLVDVAVMGDGEFTAVELSQAWAEGRGLEGIKGIAHSRDGQVVRHEPRPDTKLDSLHMPDYGLVEGLERFTRRESNKDGWVARMLPVYSGSGCPYRCAFCINTVLKKPWNGKSGKRLADEVEALIQAHGLNGISMVDELFFANRQRVFEFAGEIERRQLKFTWIGAMSVHTMQKYSDKELRRLQEAGLALMGLGVESGSAAQLKRLNKKITVPQILEVARRSERLGLRTTYSFLIGTPHETRQDMADTLRLMLEIRRHSPRHAVIYWAQIFRPYPGSVLYDQAVALGFKSPERLEDWSSMSHDENNGFTRTEDLPWLDPGTAKLIEDLNLCVSVYCKRPEFLAPRRDHTLNGAPGQPPLPIGGICLDIVEGRIKGNPRYPEPVAAAPKPATVLPLRTAAESTCQESGAAACGLSRAQIEKLAERAAAAARAEVLRYFEEELAGRRQAPQG